MFKMTYFEYLMFIILLIECGYIIVGEFTNFYYLNYIFNAKKMLLSEKLKTIRLYKLNNINLKFQQFLTNLTTQI
jgi:hypothetical protein